jgi:hypothetical protein
LFWFCGEQLSPIEPFLPTNTRETTVSWRRCRNGFKRGVADFPMRDAAVAPYNVSTGLRYPNFEV